MTQYKAKWPNENGIIDWSDTENKTWKQLIKRQNEVVQNRACDEFIAGLYELQLSLDSVPQLLAINRILKKGFIPVISSVARGQSDGRLYNINADDVAAFLSSSFL